MNSQLLKKRINYYNALNAQHRQLIRSNNEEKRFLTNELRRKQYRNDLNKQRKLYNPRGSFSNNISRGSKSMKVQKLLGKY